MKKVMVLAGTRPEAIKVAPVVLAMRKSDILQPVLCSSGQHREMLAQALGDFGLSPDMDMDVMQAGQGLSQLSARLFTSVDKAICDVKPDCILVQGDTTTVAIASMCGYYNGVTVAHLEAGLRSHNKRSPFPEEVNRRIAGIVADIHFAPTQKGKDNLVAEGVDPADVFIVGNTVIDALAITRASLDAEKAVLPGEIREQIKQGRKMILVTGHRRESFGDGFLNICRAIKQLADKYPDVFMVYPVHLNPQVQQPVYDILGGHERIFLTSPLGYREFVAHMLESHLVLTDSGGVQEEAPAFGKPVLVMRDVTERVEGLSAGTARLVGTTIGGITAGVSELLDSEARYLDMARSANPYGDGTAAAQVVSILESCL
ncbi:MAG: UDP-N-acetylglucosamine 2-epimerase (non-hydrolyzing) [Pseudodesulfovibrio sp.]|nr:UDP-N-acetylglucosamine 2-epimerase (non-hydrolyzing) [Pseudodesulfovibrio sp.]